MTTSARESIQDFLQVGIITRPMASYDLSDCLRVTIKQLSNLNPK